MGKDTISSAGSVLRVKKTRRERNRMKIGFEELKACAAEIFVKAGVSEGEAQIVAEELATANLMGVDSHGVLRIPQYLKEMETGQIRPGTEMKIVRETPVTAVLDCRQNFGQVGARRMVDIVSEKTKKSGMACAVSLNANHIGRLGSYTEALADRGLIAFGAVGVYAAGPMAPWGALDPRLGTNPISWAVPREGHKPLVMDCATTVVAEGKLRAYVQNGKQVPKGWIKDGYGNDTTDPLDFYKEPRGTIMPMGGAVSGAKGSGFAIMADMFSVVLANDDYWSWEENGGIRYAENGIFLMALDPEAFYGKEAYARQCESHARFIKSARPAEGVDEVLLPGEFEQNMAKRRLAEGIDLADSTWDGLIEIARGYKCRWSEGLKASGKGNQFVAY